MACDQGCDQGCGQCGGKVNRVTINTVADMRPGDYVAPSAVSELQRELRELRDELKRLRKIAVRPETLCGCEHCTA